MHFVRTARGPVLVLGLKYVTNEGTLRFFNNGNKSYIMYEFLLMNKQGKYSLTFEINWEQYRQRMCDVTLRRVSVTNVAVEKQ